MQGTVYGWMHAAPYMYTCAFHYSTLETSQEFCILMLNVRRSSHTTSSQPLRPPFLFRYRTTVVSEHLADFNCLYMQSVPREWNLAFNARQPFYVTFVSYLTSQHLYGWNWLYATGVNSGEGTAISQTNSKTVLRKKPSQTRHCDARGKFYWDHVTTMCTYM